MTPPKRVTLRGYMLVPDDFGRVRLLLVKEGPGNRPDYSAEALRRALPGGGPHELRDAPNTDGEWGAVWFALPPRHRAHWLKTAAELRGRWVVAEAAPRAYAFPDGRRGVSLDLAMLEECRN
jgi:hypothetical protein